MTKFKQIENNLKQKEQKMENIANFVNSEKFTTELQTKFKEQTSYLNNFMKNINTNYKCEYLDNAIVLEYKLQTIAKHNIANNSLSKKYNFRTMIKTFGLKQTIILSKDIKKFKKECVKKSKDIVLCIIENVSKKSNF